LKIHTHVREDALQLFGFKTVREKELFRNDSVSGIGPSWRLQCTMSVLELVPAMQQRRRG
jgi:Holliday junction DNA helicase RuvA